MSLKSVSENRSAISSTTPPWTTDTNPSCLRIDASKETHILPYTHFVSATFREESGKHTISITFSTAEIHVVGSNLNEMTTDLETLSISRITESLQRYRTLEGNDQPFIEKIAIKSLR